MTVQNVFASSFDCSRCVHVDRAPFFTSTQCRCICGNMLQRFSDWWQSVGDKRKTDATLFHRSCGYPIVFNLSVTFAMFINWQPGRCFFIAKVNRMAISVQCDSFAVMHALLKGHGYVPEERNYGVSRGCTGSDAWCKLDYTLSCHSWEIFRYGIEVWFFRRWPKRARSMLPVISGYSSCVCVVCKSNFPNNTRCDQNIINRMGYEIFKLPLFNGPRQAPSSSPRTRENEGLMVPPTDRSRWLMRWL